MSLWKSLWHDECGSILCAEAVLLGTVGLVGAGVGMSMVSESVNEELKDTAYSLRCLDQSYAYKGFRSKHAWTPGSYFIQPDIDESLQAMYDQEKQLEYEQAKDREEAEERLERIQRRREAEERREEAEWQREFRRDLERREAERKKRSKKSKRRESDDDD